MEANTVSPLNALRGPIPSSLSQNTPSPKVKKTYANFFCDIKLSKTETHRVCLEVGGNNLTYEGDPRSPETSLLDLKIHLNSVISDAHKGARYLTADIINYYLNKPMANFQYMHIRLKEIPNEVVVEYSLLPIADTSGYIYVAPKVKKNLRQLFLRHQALQN